MKSEFEHSMRNWIDGIRFAAEVISAESDPSPSQRQMLDHILSGAEACTALLNQHADRLAATAEPLSPELLAAISSLE